MPDDREVGGSDASDQLLTNMFPGQAATDEMVLSRETEALESDDILVTKPLGFLFWMAIGWLGLVFLLAVFANLLPLPNPDFQNYSAINATPNIHHLLGTDDLGRDLLSRLIVGFASVAIGTIVGGTLGLISGFKGGSLDISLNAASFVLLAFPAIVAVIAIVAFWGASLLKITIIIDRKSVV